MRKKITSLSVLLLTGALVLTSCVKSEEDDSTKALRTAQEQRALEKLSEDKQLAANQLARATHELTLLAQSVAKGEVDVEQAKNSLERAKLTLEQAKRADETQKIQDETNKLNAEKAKEAAEYAKTLVKTDRLFALLEEKINLLSEIQPLEAALKNTQNEKADKEATQASLQSKVDLLKEKVDRNLAQLDRQIALKEHEKQTIEAADLTDPTELKKQKTTKEYAKTVENQKVAPLNKTYQEAEAAAVKSFTDNVLATDFAKVLYKNSGNNTYNPVYSPDATPYVVNFTHAGFLDYGDLTTEGIRNRDFTFIANDDDATKPVVDGVTYNHFTAKKQVSVKRLDQLQADILNATVSAPDYAPYNTAIENAQANVNSAQTAYNTDPSAANRTALANAREALQNAKDAKQGVQDAYNNAMETANKLKAVQTAITAEGNLDKINKVIRDFNAALPNVAKEYAAYQKAVKKVDELQAEINALTALIGGNQPKADVIKGVEDAITDLKEQKRAAQYTHDNTNVKGNITDVARAIEQKQALIEHTTKLVELKKAKLQKVEAQIAAVSAE